MSTESNGTLSTTTSASNLDEGGELKSNPSSSAELLQAENVDPKELYKNVDENNTEALEEGDRSILVQLLRQVFAGGLDLTKVTMPVNFLEPRSMLEKLTDFMTHAHMLATAADPDDPQERMLNLVKLFLSGWHVKPRGVKKPYNPAIGEVFRCHYYSPNGPITYFAEQVSHHPPISAVFSECVSKNISLEGWYYPRTKLAGMNSAASMNEGCLKIYMKNRNEVYSLTWPNVYAKGIIYGRLLMEYGGKSHIVCKETGYSAEIDFKLKPIFGGEYNNVVGKIKKKGTTIFTIRGKWNDKYYIKAEKSKTEELFLDVNAEKRFPKYVIPIENQLPNESRNLWKNCSDALRRKDIKAANEEKSKIESKQREAVAERDKKGEVYQPKFFERSKDEKDFWVFKGNNTSEYQILLNDIEGAQPEIFQGG